MRPPVTATDEKPAPRFFAVMTRRGPPGGHAASRPVSGERPSRLAPRQPGQSAGRCCASAVTAAPATIRAMNMLVMRDLIHGLLDCRIGRRTLPLDVGSARAVESAVQSIHPIMRPLILRFTAVALFV